MAKKSDKVKNPHAVALGSRGGKRRMSSLSKAQRTALGKMAAKGRWGDRKGTTGK